MELPDTLTLINPAIRAQKAYHLERREVAIKLNQNENPYDWPRPIKEEIARFCVERPWNRYPPFVPEELKVLLGGYAGVSPDCIIVGNGSNEMLLVLMLAVAKKGEPIILCQPTFTVYHLFAEGVGAGSETVYLDEKFRFNLPSILAAIERRPQAPILLCSPNNPTGCVLDEASIRKIVETHRGFVILDQAYVEFGGFSAVQLVAQYPNVVVTRTFSKAFAGAGLRIGYMIGSPPVISEINKIKPPYNINFFTEHVARMALRHRAELTAGIRTIIEQRGACIRFLSTLPLDVYPSAANFILIRTNRKQELFNALLADGILVRDVSAYPMLENCLRISVGAPEENRLLRQSMERFFNR
ncbi:MAG: histidinol-phosphate transaminase [Chitinispirillaceae bacterium]|nr:histidinol-phosphate transaminase [Chitinispirillaceae bacterium]